MSHLENHSLLEKEERTLGTDTRLSEEGIQIRRHNHQKLGRNDFWYTIFAFSVIVNIAFLISSLTLDPRERRLNGPTQFAELEQNVQDPYYDQTPYGSDNNTLVAKLWTDINVDDGVVALPDAMTENLGLPRAQRFPWDDNKGIYILHGFHNLHCLKIIHISLLEHRMGTTQSRAWPHISHCLDALRRQILCDADDTPRAVLQDRDGVSGTTQTRQCRSFQQLREFAQRHTACYKRPEKPIHDMPNIEKYKHCPEGSSYMVPASVWY